MRKRKYTPVDYAKRQGDRKKLTNYLRTGNFKKIAGSHIYSLSIQRRRSMIILAFLLFAGYGLYHAIF